MKEIKHYSCATQQQVCKKTVTDQLPAYAALGVVKKMKYNVLPVFQKMEEEAPQETSTINL